MLWKMTVMLILVWALGADYKKLEKRLGEQEIRGCIETI